MILLRKRPHNVVKLIGLYKEVNMNRFSKFCPCFMTCVHGSKCELKEEWTDCHYIEEEIEKWLTLKKAQAGFVVSVDIETVAPLPQN